MIVANELIRLNIGDNDRYIISIKNEDNTDYEMGENDVLSFIVKRSMRCLDDDYVIRKDQNSKTVHLVPEDTKDLQPGRYFYVVRLQKEDGTRRTIVDNTPFILVR